MRRLDAKLAGQGIGLGDGSGGNAGRWRGGAPPVVWESNPARRDGKEPPLVDNAERVTAGVVTLIELNEKGWTIVRP